MQQRIELKNVTVHNLQGVDLELTPNQLIVFTGVSGSGKSSMAFDTIYAEGQRRYVESLSTQARRHLDELPKPQLDHAAGLSPTISIEQKTIGRNPRSTVGTLTDIYNYLRVLYAKVAHPHCPISGEPVAPRSPDDIVREVQKLPRDSQLIVLAPVSRAKKGNLKEERELLLRKGFMRARIDGIIHRLDEKLALDATKSHQLDAVIDRVTVNHGNQSRLAESVTLALDMGGGSCSVLIGERELLLSTQSYAPKSGLSYQSLQPQDFSFNSPQGMCERCQGLGVVEEFALDQIIDANKSIAEDCCSVASSNSTVYYGNIYRNLARLHKFKLTTPWKDLEREAQEMFLYGTKQKWTRMTFVHPKTRRRSVEYIEWKGVLHEARGRLGQAKSERYRQRMQKLMTSTTCPVCKSTRIKPYPSAAQVVGKGIAELTAMTVEECREFFDTLVLPEAELEIADELLKEVRQRLAFLSNVGLGYLTLNRTAPTLSGGEAQRVRLASQIGCGLVGVTYILDEPSIGLHLRDNQKLIEALEALRDRGNTVIVVEHDEETIWAADHIVDFGPKAGLEGGQIVVNGKLEDLLECKESLTGDYLSGRKAIATPKRRRVEQGKILIAGATHHNLKGIDVEIPLGVLVAVTGVSGSGKSSLVGDILYPALANALQRAKQPVGAHKTLRGVEQLEKVIVIDQAPIGRNIRSNPATYIKLFDLIRDLYSQLPEAKARGYAMGRFSFNVAEGSCSNCAGMGEVRIDMDFLEDAYLTCPLCHGRRFDAETLEVKFKDKSIYDVLEMSVTEALEFFDNLPALKHKLKTLERVGLGYVKLGQSSKTLSGGEAQRIKLARELSRPAQKGALYILDEPTTGLHFHDIGLLLRVLSDLVDQGNSVAVIEHNMDVVKTADWIIDLGPEGGAGGGTVVATGTPEVICKQNTPTGRAIKQALNPEGRTAQDRAKPASEQVAEIVVKGAAQNNLKHVDVIIPRGKITVCTGPSGSGKSSLAFETIYAEGQRRYIESLSPYARQFVKQCPKPRVTSVEGLSPAVAIEQKAHAGNPRSTVGTQTESYDYLRLLYARAGTAHCPETGERIRSISKEHVVERLLSLPDEERVVVLAPLKEELERAAERYRRQGYLRLRVNGNPYELDGPMPEVAGQQVKLELVIDRLKVRKPSRMRLLEAVETAASIGGQQVIVLREDGSELFFNLSFAVESTGKSYPEITPHTFSFNHINGMCSQCQGLGAQHGIKLDALPQGLDLCGLLEMFWPWGCEEAIELAVNSLEAAGVPEDLPIEEMNEQQQQSVFNGSPKGWVIKEGVTYSWRGINEVLSSLSRGGRWQLRQSLSHILAEQPCLSCEGERLNPLARHVRLDSVTIGQLCNWPVEKALRFVEKLRLRQDDQKVLGEVHKQLLVRLRFLCEVGLGYLSLSRSAPTLSNGEAQRIRLARQLGTGLTGVLYVLDEPTVGLHPHDNALLNKALRQLKELGNTILMVEHEPLTVKQADYLLDFGPKAGRQGGKLVAKGSVKQIQRSASITGHYLSGKKTIARSRGSQAPTKGYRVQGGLIRNLQTIDVTLPIGQLICITGVSGSGKSTLLHQIIEPRIKQELWEEACPFSNVIVLNQDPIGHTNRSDVGTFTDILTLIRDLFAKVSSARAKGLRPGNFSTNHRKGMCSRCWGLGYRKVSLHFLPSVKVTCDECHGQRLKPASLEVEYTGVNFGKVLDSTVEEALELFGNVPRVRKKLERLIEIGLGYLKLGQEVVTLSGGEAQRLRLSRELGKRSTGQTLYLLDEPTTGLHYSDVDQLLKVLHALVEKGNTLVVVEHNLDLIKNADHVIDLGPGPGAAGGQIVASGTPEEIASCPESKTGHYLAKELALCAV